MPRIAYGFDSASNIPKSMGIFGESIEIKEDFTSSFDFTFSVFRSISDFKESLKLRTESGMPIVSGVNLKAALEVSGALSLDQDALIYVMHVCGVRRRLTVDIDQEKFEEDTNVQRARNELTENPYVFLSKYGDAFVKRILYGGEVALVIRFKKRTTENSKRLLAQLNLNVSKGVDLQQAISLLRDSATLKLECDIYTHTKGFTAEQLPADPRKFADLSKWLSDFSTAFYAMSAEACQTSVGYEIESYGAIFPIEAVAIIDNTTIRARYFFAIFRCDNAIDYYIKYFDWIGDNERLVECQLKKDELAAIKAVFVVKQDLNDPLLLQPISDLRKMVQELNAIKLNPKLINEFTSADLSRNLVRTGDSTEELRVSPSFQIPHVPEGLIVAGLTTEVFKDDDKPLRGNLSLLYSFHSKVPFGEASHEMARHINRGLRNNASIPRSLQQDSSLYEVNFAYHLVLPKSIIFQTQHLSRCIRPFLETSEEPFRVVTYLVHERPWPIMPII